MRLSDSMHDFKQFKPLLYLVVGLGLSGFAVAAESPGFWGFCVLAVGINAWLVKSGRFAPMPRWLANVVTIGALVYVVVQIHEERGPPLMFIGQFLAFLQLVKLFEQRANRDYAQLLVLSLLLMVAATINTTSLLFGLLMLVYVVLSLYCCLMFHLKVEADRAKEAFPVPPEKGSPATVQQDRRYLSSSMRRLTALVWVVATCTGVGVFLFFPRVAGQALLGQLQLKAVSAMTGFSEQVSFDQITRIKQNEEVVARVTVWKGDRPLAGIEPLYLRGLTLNSYGPESGRLQRYQWTHNRDRREEELAADGELRTFLRPQGIPWVQRVRLEPSKSRYLFALQGVTSVKVDRQVGIRYSAGDGSLLLPGESINTAFDYEVVSSNAPSKPNLIDALTGQIMMSASGSDAQVLQRIREYTLRAEVTDGLAAQRTRAYGVADSNEEIARKLERHLKSNFLYTLDLTDYRRALRDGDPVINFLTKVKRGHCEYFASAMTLMCQSIGIPARMVIGFRCDEYNVVGGFYVVRQSHAHSWVEALTPRGWVAFDPTSGREDLLARRASLWQSLKQFFEFMEYKWAEKVVAYDPKDRDEMLRTLDTAMTKGAVGVSGWLAWLRQQLDVWRGDSDFWTSFYRTFFNVLSLLIALMVASIIGAIVWYLVSHRRLRRRAHRIGFGMLPKYDQLRLARQLAFYDLLTRLLLRKGIVRPPHLTAQEFAHSLVFLPTEAYHAIRRLTCLFYRVRFGSDELNPHRQRRLEAVVHRLDEAIDRLPWSHAVSHG